MFTTIVVSTLTFVAGWYVSYFRIKNALKKEGIEMSFHLIEYKHKDRT